MPGKLTTHILDTAQGKPGAGVKVELWRLGDKTLIKTIVTNQDGRSDSPLLEGGLLNNETYELLFHIGDYFKTCGLDLPEPAFLNIIPIRFTICDQNAHYHVPLLVSPWSYSTYRGS